MHQNGGSGEKAARAWLAPVFFVPALALAAAHVWRAGQAGEAAALMVWALMCLTRRAWMRPLAAALLLLLAGEWLVTTQSLMEMRVALGRPWTRLAIIMLAVTAFTAGAALPTSAKAGRAWFCRGRERGFMQAAAFLLAFAPLFGMARFAPQLMLVHRLVPGFGVMQALAAGCWSAWVCARLADRTKAGRTRLFAWRLFSVVFFAQFFLSLAGWSLFSMTGEWHIPVPGVIVAGALYRGAAGFMPLLFAVSVLVAACGRGLRRGAGARHDSRSLLRQPPQRLGRLLHPDLSAGAALLPCGTAFPLARASILHVYALRRVYARLPLRRAHERTS